VDIHGDDIGLLVMHSVEGNLAVGGGADDLDLGISAEKVPRKSRTTGESSTIKALII
jgi:hypothetical protein